MWRAVIVVGIVFALLAYACIVEGARSAGVKNEIPGSAFRKKKLHSVKCWELCKKLRGQLHIKIAVDRAVLTHRFDGGGNLAIFACFVHTVWPNPLKAGGLDLNMLFHGTEYSYI